MDTVNIKKYFYQILSIFAALLLAFSIAQIPVQAAAKPGTVKLSSMEEDFRDYELHHILQRGW